MRRAAALLALVLLTAARGPMVTTDAGAVEGERIGKGAAFRGIPFATADRWRDPRPAPEWAGVRAARDFGPACPQRAETGRPVLPQGEDCLNLNVLTPDLKARGLPVLVSIHGGAYAFGSNRYVTDQGITPLLRKGVVLVAPNYRLGRFGFFAHPALSAEAGRGTGNFWLADQILALDWVRRNIARFGGDPARVTVLGCSAGGSSVNALMASPAARGLFHRAAAHSGGGFFNANRQLGQAERQGEDFARRAGVTDGGAPALERLRALSVEQVLAADPGPPDFGAIVDGRLLPAPLSHIFARGEQAGVPYLVGSTSNEASVFGLMGFDASVMKARFGIDLDALRPLYGPLTEAELLRRVQTDSLFTSAALGMGGLAARKAPAFTYHFAHVPAAERATSPGAPHCADMAWLFGPLPDSSAEGRRLAAEMRAYWYRFIAHGDPNGGEQPRWPAVRPGQPGALLFDRKPRHAPDFGARAMPVWFARWRAESGQAIDP